MLGRKLGARKDTVTKSLKNSKIRSLMICTLRLIYCSMIITYEGNKNGGESSARGKMRNACNIVNVK